MATADKPQSWASWLFEQYTTTTSLSTESAPFYDDDVDREHTTGQPLKRRPREPSPYGAHIRTGRGGAGNFTWQSEQTAADTEQDAPVSLKERRRLAKQVECVDTSAAIRAAQARQTGPIYLRTGRGGAGNIPLVVGQSNEPQSPRSASPRIVSPVVQTPTVRTGRGGAGNLAAGHAAVEHAQAEREKAEMLEAEKRRAEAEAAVEESLRPPTQAFLGQERRSRLPDDVQLASRTERRIATI